MSETKTAEGNSLLGSYKVKAFLLLAAMGIIPVAGAFVLVGMRGATFEQAADLTKWIFGTLGLSNLGVIVGRAAEGYAEKRDSPAPKQVVAGEIKTLNQMVPAQQREPPIVVADVEDGQ